MVFLTISTLFCSVLLVRQYFRAEVLISSDGIGYFVHLPSILLDGDVDYREEMAALGLPMARNQWSIGTAIAWLPFYLVGHLISLAGAAWGLSWQTDGLGLPEQILVCLGTCIYGAAAVAVCYKTACRWFDSKWSLLGSCLLFAGSNLPYYLLVEPYMAHGVSAFFTSLLLFLGLRTRPLSRREWALIGLVAGLCALTRIQDGLIVAAPLLWNALRFGGLRAIGQAVVLCGTISFALLCIQLGIWQRGFEIERAVMQQRVEEQRANQVISNPEPVATETPAPRRKKLSERPSRIIKGGRLAWTEPAIGSQFFGRYRGLVTWHPVNGLAIIGLIFLSLKKPRLGAAVVFAALLQTYVIASWDGQGQSFGSRQFLGTYGCFNLGLVALLALSSTRWRRLCTGIGSILVLESLYVLLRYRNLLREGVTNPDILRVLGF